MTPVSGAHAVPLVLGVPTPAFAPGLIALLAVAAAYFALGVGVGMLIRPRRRQRALALLFIVPGTLTGVTYLVWVIWTLTRPWP
jgi:hypothetical protein